MRALVAMMRRHEKELLRFADQQMRRFKDLVSDLRDNLQQVVTGMPSGSTLARSQYAEESVPRAFRRARQEMPGLLREAAGEAMEVSIRHATEVAAFHGVSLVLDGARGLNRSLLADYPATALTNSLISQVQAAALSSVTLAALQESGITELRAIMRSAQTSLVTRLSLLVGAQVNSAYAASSASVATMQPPVPPAPTERSRTPKRWVRRIYETIDGRNHPFSRAAHGTVAVDKKPFKVSKAAVDAAASRMGRKGNTGIFWRLSGGNYVGQSLPAHFNERGRVVPWLMAWDWPESEEP